jgi:hypothetical protein
MKFFSKKRTLRTTLLSLGLLFLIIFSTCVQPHITHADLDDLDVDYLLTADVAQNTVTAAKTTIDAGSAVSTAASTGGSLIQNTITAAQSVLSATGLNALVVKGYTLDPLAWAVAKSVLNSLVQSTVKWINSGFQGAPAFVTNLNSTLLTVSNSTADSFITQLSSNGSINSPFQTQVASAVASNYNTNTNGGFFAANPYTLNQTSSNPQAFLNNNFSYGGFDAWMSEVMNPSNNPYGLYEVENTALNSQVATAQANQKTELNWGKGFMSYKGNCNSPTTSSASGKTTTSLSGNTTCSNASILTPGAAIESQLEKTLGSGIDQLVTANQFNEIVNALVGQLTNQVLGSGGLTGVSQPSTSGGGSYLDQISASQSATTNSLSTSFTQTISGQLAQLQAFQSEWSTLNTAAEAAQSALANSTCYPNAQTALATIVQPTIAKAATEIANANTSITALQAIQTEATPVSTSNSTAGITQASTDYSNLLSSPTLPSSADIQNAVTQSTDTGTSTVPSLYTQLIQITNEATTCQATPQTTQVITPAESNQ